IFGLVGQQENTSLAILDHLVAIVYRMDRRVQSSPVYVHTVAHTVVTVYWSAITRKHIAADEHAAYCNGGAFLEQGSSFHMGGRSGWSVAYCSSAAIGESIASAEVCEDQAFVIETHQVQNGGMQVMYMHGVLNNVISEVISLAVYDPRLHASTGHPDAKAAGMVVAAIVVPLQLTRGVVGAAKFAAPDYERFVQ